MKTATYGMTVRLTTPFETSRDLIIEALREEGFGILTEIDVQAVMREKTGTHMPQYAILGACNPELAHSALMEDHDFGLIMPCNVVVREDEYGGSAVSILDPDVVARASNSLALHNISGVLREKLSRVLRTLEDESIE
jgi:uncharacterized protein (DUF302 family)